VSACCLSHTRGLFLKGLLLVDQLVQQEPALNGCMHASDFTLW
jgi:hypothetical protein